MLVVVFQEHIAALTGQVIAIPLLAPMAPGQLLLYHMGQGLPRSQLPLWPRLVLKPGLSDHRVTSERLESTVQASATWLALSPAM